MGGGRERAEKGIRERGGEEERGEREREGEEEREK